MRILRPAASSVLTLFVLLSRLISDAAPVQHSITVRQADASGCTLELITPQDPTLASTGLGMIRALPPGTHHVRITPLSSTERIITREDLDPALLRELQDSERELVHVSPVMTMRGWPLAAIALNPLQYDPATGDAILHENLRVRVDYSSDGSAPRPALVSHTFHTLLRGIAANLDEIIPGPDPSPEPYLVIAPRGYDGTALGSFVEWKRQRGHTVTVSFTDEIGATNQAIRAHIQTAYETWPEPPVFVVLVGDVDGTNPVPGWIVDGYHAASIITDHPYTLIDGDDYLPDVLIGRLSVDTEFELQTVISKCVGYESNPYLPHGEWRSRMMIVGVRSTADAFQTYNSAWPTLRWIGDEFLRQGYTEIDSVPYPGGNSSQINVAINEGVSFIAYRGFGSPVDWAYPHYSISDIGGVHNGGRLPVITSIVCGGGAFESQTDPCFGEEWLRHGTPAAPSGAIGFIGPSELDTKTRWNNTIVAGIYQGILHEGVSTLGAAMVRGKLELIREFPNHVQIDEPNADTSVPFYFRCYNLLGDPGLTYFVGPVQDLDYSVMSDPSYGSPSVTISVSDAHGALADVWGTITTADGLVSRTTSDPGGTITLELPQHQPGPVTVTLTKPRHAPRIFDLNLAQEGVAVAASSLTLIDDGSQGSIGNGDQRPNPGETVALEVVFSNFGSDTYPGGELQVSPLGEEFIVLSTPQPLPSLSPGASTQPLVLLVRIAADAPDGAAGRLSWLVTGSDGEWTTEHEIHAPALTIEAIETDGADANPEPGATQTLNLTLLNSGRSAMPASTASLSCEDPRITVVSATASYPAIPPTQSASGEIGGWTIEVADMLPGEWIPIEIRLVGGGIESLIDFDLPIGNLTQTDPTHPDGYGYRAFDSGDRDYIEAPQYAWIEIDPAHGGPGMALPLADQGDGYDRTMTVSLPFGFSFYGTSYDRISICTNGFLSFGETGESYFRNYALPAIASPLTMICPFWDDLTTSPNGRICVYHDDVGGRYIIEWSRMTNHYNDTAIETFELILFDIECWPTLTGDGDVLMQYKTISNVDSWDNYATIGIQDREAGYALPLSYANHSAPGIPPLRPGQSILLTTGRDTEGSYVHCSGGLIDDDDEGGSQGNGDGTAQNGETIEYQVRIANIGTQGTSAATGTFATTDPLIELLDTQTQVPAIAPGDTVAADPVRIRIAPETPDGHFAGLTLFLSGGAIPCVILPTITVTGPVLSVETLEMDDDSEGGSSGNDNGEVNPGERIELWPTISNIGHNIAEDALAILSPLSAHLNILQSTVAVGDLEPGEQVDTDTPFVVSVSTAAPNSAVLEMRVTMHDVHNLTWSRDFSYIVAVPRLEYEGFRITDPPPAGNGDGRAAPGEDVQLWVSLRNRGLGSARNVTAELSSSNPHVTITNATLEFGTVSGNSIRESDLPAQIQISEDHPHPGVARLWADVEGDNGIHFDAEVVLLIGDDLCYFDDFETGLETGWTIYGSNSFWHRQSRMHSSPSFAYYCGSESSLQYPDMADAYLRSPRFRFPGTGRLLVSTRYDIPDPLDRARIDLQIGTSTYYMLADLSGTELTWHQLEFPLSGIPASTEARVRFWFSSNFDNQGEGWYLDDVIIADEPSAIEQTPAAAIPDRLALHQNFPNPFNARTTLSYEIPHRSHVRLTLFDVTGREVASLVDRVQDPGSYRLSWQPLTLASGIYLLRLDAGDGTDVRKMVHLK